MSGSSENSQNYDIVPRLNANQTVIPK